MVRTVVDLTLMISVAQVFPSDRHFLSVGSGIVVPIQDANRDVHTFANSFRRRVLVQVAGDRTATDCVRRDRRWAFA